MRIIAAIACSALLLGATPAPSPSPIVPVFACPAPGMPTAADLKAVWSPIDMKTANAMSDDGKAKPVTLITFANGAAIIQIAFVDAIPVFYDSAPNDETVRPLLNAQMVNPDGMLKSKPGGPCAWFKSKAEGA